MQLVAKAQPSVGSSHRLDEHGPLWMIPSSFGELISGDLRIQSIVTHTIYTVFQDNSHTIVIASNVCFVKLDMCLAFALCSVSFPVNDSLF